MGCFAQCPILYCQVKKMIGGPGTSMQLKCRGYSYQVLSQAGYTAQDLRADGHAALELKHGGYSAQEIEAAGYTWRFNLNIVKPSGEIVLDSVQVEPSSEVETLVCMVERELCHPCKLVFENSILPRRSTLAKCGLESGPCLLTAVVCEARDVGCSVRQLADIGWTPRQLMDAGFTPQQLNVGYTARKLWYAGFTL